MTTCLTPTFIMPDISELAQECASRTQAPYMEWYDALSSAKVLMEGFDLDPDGFLLISRNTATPKQFTLVIEALDEHSKENPHGAHGLNMVLYYCENSPYSLGAWLEAIEYFYQWLGQYQRRAGLEPMLKYVEASIDQHSEQGAEAELKAIVQDMLDKFSFQD